MSVHGNFNNLGGNKPESRITFKDREVAGKWRNIGWKSHFILAQLFFSFVGICYYSLSKTGYLNAIFGLIPYSHF